jgi:putative transposase
MPRTPRLDAPGALHHVIARGIEKRPIFRDAVDMEGFVVRLARSTSDGGWRIYAWALLPNHFHLLVRTEKRPLERSMRSLLTGHAVAFNRRHGRVGHLFQNRYKSILCEEDAYFLELVRYIHLNPIRAGIVRGLAELGRFRFSGHATLLGAAAAPWHSVEDVLRWFDRGVEAARLAYEKFVAAGVGQGRRPELVSGRLLRRADGWSAEEVSSTRARESHAAVERVLGSDEFTCRLEQEVSKPCVRFGSLPTDPSEFLGSVARGLGIHPVVLVGASRGRRAITARSVACFVWLEALGRSGSELARALGVARASVYRAARRAPSDLRDFDWLEAERRRS